MIFGEKPLSWHSVVGRWTRIFDCDNFRSPFCKKITFLPWPFSSYLLCYITINNNYFDIRGIEISTKKNTKMKNKTGEIYRFLNEMPMRDLTPWNVRNPFNRFHMCVKPSPQLSGNYIEREPFDGYFRNNDHIMCNNTIYIYSSMT